VLPADLVVRALGRLGDAAALAQLADRARQRGRFSPGVLAEMQRVLDAAALVHGGCSCGSRSGTCCAVDDDPRCADVPSLDVGSTVAVLEDQDGRTTDFAGYVRGRPAVVTFFYTRCDNPRKCSLTITKLAALQRALGERGLAGAVRLAAITYDPAFDLPARLRMYGQDRGIRFDDDTRFFRTPSGFGELRERFGLGVNYGASTVNRHRTEVFVLDPAGDVAATFARVQWDVEAVLGVVEEVVAAAGRPDHCA
jgi:cytochrome oxidase Cu insertion factor (SCO1/SenC/PrrC family)